MTQNIKRSVLILVFSLLSACGGGQPGEGGDKPTPSPEVGAGLPLSNKTQAHGLLIEIAADKTRYTSSEIATIHASVENVSDQPVRWWTSCLGISIISIGVDTKLQGRKNLSHPDDPEACAAAIGEGDIQPGEKVTREVFWDLKISEGIAAPQGVYEITAHVNIDVNTSTRVSTSLSIEIVSNINYISELDAFTIGYGQSVIQDWFAVNAYERVCLIQSTGSIVFDNTGKASFQSGEASQGQSITTLPGCAAQLLEGPIWQVGFFSKFGVQPANFQIKIDAESGDVVDLKNELK